MTVSNTVFILPNQQRKKELKNENLVGNKPSVSSMVAKSLAAIHCWLSLKFSGWSLYSFSTDISNHVKQTAIVQFFVNHAAIKKNR
jgi:hypothetical protein